MGAQFDSVVVERRPAQAQSRQELDSYLDIVESHEPKRTILLTGRFVKEFPDSEFLGHVYRTQMDAYLTLNDHQNSIAAGEKALQLNPRDVGTLLALAKVLPNGIKDMDSSGVLDRAESYAKKAMEEISVLRAPRSLPLAQFHKVTTEMNAAAHEALGIIEFKRGQYSNSIAELELSSRQNPLAGGALFYRLGVAYLFNDNPDQARIALKRASQLGPDVVRAKAEAQLTQMKSSQ